MLLNAAILLKYMENILLWKIAANLGTRWGLSLRFYLRWVDYIDFPVGDYVTCNRN